MCLIPWPKRYTTIRTMLQVSVHQQWTQSATRFNHCGSLSAYSSSVASSSGSNSGYTKRVDKVPTISVGKVSSNEACNWRKTGRKCHTRLSLLPSDSPSKTIVCVWAHEIETFKRRRSFKKLSPSPWRPKLKMTRLYSPPGWMVECKFEKHGNF